ncbi:hypothetical protein NEUTE2DRAFT_145151 [Neurospora tetrasperma FGSC 2509]|nr:hypothetical protein NEUTE2DRAFT_145151 [Neurospora tetrasperma FGSC 2509]
MFGLVRNREVVKSRSTLSHVSARWSFYLGSWRGQSFVCSSISKGSSSLLSKQPRVFP